MGPLQRYITNMFYAQEDYILLKLHDYDNTHDFRLFYNKYWVKKFIYPPSIVIPVT